MRTWNLRCCSAGIVLVLAVAGGAAQGAVVDLGSLLDEMVDRDALARAPDPFFTCRQSSSYDRDTVAPDKEGWFANWDRSQFVRVEEREGRKEYVMHDAGGPGAIVHIWGTWHGPGGGPFSNGTLRVYIDGAAAPVIEGPAADVISGSAVVGPPLSESVSPSTPYAQRGHNLYLPIPYAKHCKITYSTAVPVDQGAKTGEALYYQINYRTYASGTSVRSFTREDLAACKDKIATVGKRLIESKPDPHLGARGPLRGTLGPGEHATLDENMMGPKAIRSLWVRINAQDFPQALRSTILEIAFDGELCVWCPVGDFFGTGYFVKPFRTWYTQVTERGDMRAFWCMPFAESAEVTLRNLGSQPVEIDSLSMALSPWSWDDRSMHFHASWRQLTKVDTGPDKDMTGKGAFDVNYVEVAGAGRYVGDTLVLFNGADAWWGEGDEKIYVDGETFPSHIGTGTEDYYGYAWCRPEYFEAPFHAQPSGAGNLTAGFSVNSRYRGLDSIPFARSLRVDMELWHWRTTRMNFAPSAFWYARPGSRSNVAPDPASAALPVAREMEDVVEVVRVPGAIEGETLNVLERTGGSFEVQTIGNLGWSRNRQLWWIDGAPGDKLVIAFPVAESGRYRVEAELTKAVDYGIVQVLVNGAKAGEPIDLFAEKVGHVRADLGEFDLAAGANRLEVVITGANAKAVKRHMFGLDYLLLTKR
ncbi:MAG TPA: DUF2961 domain-containing protein [Planctomycetes bacterium]|nr:DUF2961 domain-containing protein [Planctomycetota bacterium]